MQYFPGAEANSAANWRQSQLDEALYFMLREHGRCILLIDQFGGNPLQEQLDALPVPAATAVLNDPIFRDDPGQAPLLIELLHQEASHHALLTQSVLLAASQKVSAGLHPVCAWLVSQAPLDRLQRQLTSLLDARYPDGTNAYLRYFDPRVLPRLLKILAPGPVIPARMLGDVQIWSQLDRHGALLQHQPDSSAQAAGPMGKWNIDAAQAAAIDRIGNLNLVVRQLARLGHMPPHSDDAAIDALLLAGVQRGLLDTGDQLAFAWRAYLYGTQFTALPELAECIATALGEGIPLDTMLQEHIDPALAGAPALAS